MNLVLVATTAAAQSRITLEQFQTMLVEVAPLVEEQTSRSIKTLPEVELAGTERIIAHISAADAGFLRATGLYTHSEGARIRKEATDFVADALAVYSDANQTIYIHTDHIQDLLGGTNNIDTLLEPLMRCVLIHELTHHIQHQETVLPIGATMDPALGRSSRMLMEGHATWVESELCTNPEVVRYQARHFGESLAAREPDDQLVDYGYGRIFVGALVGDQGTDAIWGARSQGPSPKKK